jgi:DNA-binding response OmpR family regulator
VSEDPRGSGVLGRISASPTDKTALATPVDVLLVSPDPVLRGKMVGVLRRSAYTVVEVESADAAGEAVQQGGAPRLLVLDLEGASRAERRTFASLRQAPGCAGALVLSRVGSDEVPGLSPEVTLLKPVDAAELVEAVRRLCGTLGA